MCWIDKQHCEPGIKCLDNYRKTVHLILRRDSTIATMCRLLNGIEGDFLFGPSMLNPRDPPDDGAQSMMWVVFQLAVEEVERRLGLSWGAAQKLLIEAVKNGEVVLKDGYYVLDTSLTEWLKAKQGPAKRSQRKRDLAKQAVKALWPDGTPEAVTNQQLVQEVGRWIVDYCERQGLPRQEPSRDTILRAAGRKG